MRILNRIYSALSLAMLILVAALTGCGGGGSGDPNGSGGVGSSSAPVQVSLAPGQRVENEALVGLTGPLRAFAKLDDGSTVDITSSAVWQVSDSRIEVITGANGAKSLKGIIVDAINVTLVYQGKAFVLPVKFVRLEITGSPASISLGSPSTSLKAMAVFQFGADGTPNSIDVTSVMEWASSKSEVASVVASGPALGLLETKTLGSTKITAKLIGGELETSLDFLVTASVLKRLTVVGGGGDPLQLGGSLNLIVTGHFEDNSILPLTNEVVWTSSDPSIATVINGRVDARRVGSTTITLVLGNVSTSQFIMVESSVKSIRFGLNPGAVPRGLTNSVFVVGVAANGTYGPPPLADVEWVSSNPAIIEIRTLGDQLTRELFAKGAVGEIATITATHPPSGSAPISMEVAVGAPTLKTITSLSAPVGVPLIAGGGSLQLIALGTLSDNSFTQNINEDVTNFVSCLSSSSTASVVGNCLVTGLSTGQATIEATSRFSNVTDTKAETSVTVINGDVKKVDAGTLGANGVVNAAMPADGSPALFTLAGATPGKLYTLRVPGGYRLRVAANEAMTYRLCEDVTPASNGSLACAIQSLDGKVYFSVQGAPVGSSVPVDVREGAAVDSGSFVVSSSAQLSFPFKHEFLGVENEAFTVVVTNESVSPSTWRGELALSRSDKPLCQNSFQAGKSSVACGVSRSALGARFEVALGVVSDVRVSLSSRLFITEGTVSKPISISLNQELVGQVSANEADITPSVYEIAELPANKTYDVILYGSTSQLFVQFFKAFPPTNRIPESKVSVLNPSTGREETRVSFNTGGGSNLASVKGIQFKVLADLSSGSATPLIPSAETGGSAFKLIVQAH